MEYGREIQTEECITDNVLENYAKDSYLDGLLLLDADGNVEAQFDDSGLGSENVLNMVERDALMDMLYFGEKTYAIRVVMDDESHVDLAAVNRVDEKGIVVGYFYTSAAYARIVNNSIRAIVSGFVPETNGTIVISSGNEIIVSNDKSLEGTKVEDTEILNRIMERGTGKKLIHAKDTSSTFGHHFGLMQKSRDYYIYAFMDERKVFTSTFPNTNAHICERAIREIYLKGFEIAVKTAQPMSMMTSYNLINGVHTANSYDLLTKIARGEWGFSGFIMTDWGTTGRMQILGEETKKYGSSSAAGCIKAGNDLIMPGSAEDVEEIIASVDAEEGTVECPITLRELQVCAKHILDTILHSIAYETEFGQIKENKESR